MAPPDARLLVVAGACVVLLANLGALPVERDSWSLDAPAYRRLHAHNSSDGVCARITKARVDQLEWHQAKACLGECFQQANAKSLPVKIAMWGILVAPSLLFIITMIVVREVPRSQQFPAFVLLVFLVGLCSTVWLDDFTGLFFGKKGTLCLKSLTCTAFGWTPAWLGLGLGGLFGAWSVYHAFNVELSPEKLRTYCGRQPRDDDSGEKKKLCFLFPVSLETAEAFKVNKKFSICFGDIILDTSGLLNFLRKGQPYYAIMTLMCIFRAEFSRDKVDEDYTPHWMEVKKLRGWQADFIVYWRESRLLGMTSSAFLYRATLEFQNETAWTSFIAISALLSSTCRAWFSLGQLLASMAAGSLSVMDWAQDLEQSLAEDDISHGYRQPDSTEYEEVTHVRVIPRADHFARTNILGNRSLGMVKAYRLCEFLSKAIVSTALLHFLSPFAFYLAGLVFAAILWPWRKATGHQAKLPLLFFWFFPYLMLGNYAITLPTSKGWQEPDSSSPAITATFLGLLWALLLAQTVHIGWAQAVITRIQVVSYGFWDGSLCEEARLQESTGAWHHWPEEEEEADHCDFKLTPSRVHRAVKGLIILLGLMAELGLICTAIRLAMLRRKWLDADEERLKAVERQSEIILYRELGGDDERPKPAYSPFSLLPGGDNGIRTSVAETLPLNND